MAFLPKGYEVPKAPSRYLKPTDGQIKFRVISDAIFGFEYWTKDKDGKNKPVRLKDAPKEKPADVRLEDDGSYSVKPFLAFTAIDRWDNLIKVVTITQSGVMKQIESYFNSEDWGDPKNYDLAITGTGQGKERRYTTIAIPPKPLTDDEKKLISENPVNLNALFSGGDPFDSKIVKPEEEVKLADVPF